MSEWAQLLAGPPPKPPLERGHWYTVLDRLKTGMLRVSGPNAVGEMVHEDVVRVIDREPNKVTRVQATGLLRKEPGQPTPMMSFYGVCPKGHLIDRVGIGDSEVECRQCPRKYLIEDEHHF